MIAAISMTAFAQDKEQSVTALSWMAGCWQINDGTSVTDEQWMKPLGGVMLGVARSVRSGKVVNYEFTRIELRDGAIFYVAKPSQNKEETAFKLVSSSRSEAIFENLQHDFPQRIIYRRTGDKLFARVEASKDGKTKGFDYNFTSSPCG